MGVIQAIGPTQIDADKLSLAQHQFSLGLNIELWNIEHHQVKCEGSSVSVGEGTTFFVKVLNVEILNSISNMLVWLAQLLFGVFVIVWFGWTLHLSFFPSQVGHCRELHTTCNDNNDYDAAVWDLTMWATTCVPNLMTQPRVILTMDHPDCRKLHVIPTRMTMLRAPPTTVMTM